MQQGGESTGINHQKRGGAVNRTVHIQVVALAHMDCHASQASIIHTRRNCFLLRFQIPHPEPALAIEQSASGKKNLGAEDAVDFMFAPKTGSAALPTEIDFEHWF